MALIKHAGVNCTDAYNGIFSGARHHCASGSSVRCELADNDAMKPTPPHFSDLAGEAPPPRFPVLIATVTRFRSDELPLESRAFTLEQRANATDHAIQQAYDLLRYLS